MDVVAATRAYEDWLGDELEVVSKDLDRKHKRMRESPFVFLRGSYYRWLQRIDALAPELAGPSLACVGDLHVENFGTWRDAEGRLVWGINDFDENDCPTRTTSLASRQARCWRSTTGCCASAGAQPATPCSRAIATR
jgi:uncharacterized protein (DUF2252 family)